MGQGLAMNRAHIVILLTGGSGVGIGNSLLVASIVETAAGLADASDTISFLVSFCCSLFSCFFKAVTSQSSCFQGVRWLKI